MIPQMEVRTSWVIYDGTTDLFKGTVEECRAWLNGYQSLMEGVSTRYMDNELDNAADAGMECAKAHGAPI